MVGLSLSVKLTESNEANLDVSDRSTPASFMGGASAQLLLSVIMLMGSGA